MNITIAYIIGAISGFLGGCIFSRRFYSGLLKKEAFRLEGKLIACIVENCINTRSQIPERIMELMHKHGWESHPIPDSCQG